MNGSNKGSVPVAASSYLYISVIRAEEGPPAEIERRAIAQ
jgi:hypothetical protein